MLALALALQTVPPDPSPPPCRPLIKINRWLNQMLVEKSSHFNFQLAGTGSADFTAETLTLTLAPTAEAGYLTARIHEVDLSLTGKERDAQKCWNPAASLVEIEYRIKWDTAEFNPALTESAYLVNAPETMADPWTVAGIVRSPLTQGYSVVVGQNVVLTAAGLQGFFSIEPLAQIDPTQWHDVSLCLTGNQADIVVQQGAIRVEVNKEAPEPFAPLAMAFSIDNEGVPGQITPPSAGSRLHIDYYHARSHPAA
ncbi:MAG: hypothetical protein R6X32_02230 [Chloroflexota bacterium]